MFCYRIGGISRNPNYMDFTKSCLKIDIIISRTAKGNYFNIMLKQVLYDFFVYCVIYKSAYRIKAIGQLHGLGIKMGIKIVYIKSKPSFTPTNDWRSFCFAS